MLGIVTIGTAAGCLDQLSTGDREFISPNPEFTVEEAFFTPGEGENIDQPAVWHGESTDLLLVTGKESHDLTVYNAADGRFIKSIGRQGSELNEFDRPNGLFVIDNLALVVERDNQRVQVLNLPSGRSLGTFGENQLRRPYEAMVYESERGYEVYVTDDYSTSDGARLDERVKHYWFSVSNGEITAQHVKSFGATSGSGVLNSVESIYADPTYDRLMIADEDENAIKLYNLEGEFLEVITERFDENDPEGITLHREDDESGYWVFTEQEPDRSEFHVFDRESLDYVTTFAGEEIANTDGIWLTQQPLGSFTNGAFYAVHNDSTVGAFDWSSILTETDR